MLMPAGIMKFVTSPFEPIVGDPMNFVPLAASKKRPVCSAWLIVRSSISITVSPVYFATPPVGGIGWLNSYSVCAVSGDDTIHRVNRAAVVPSGFLFNLGAIVHAVPSG